MFDQFKNKLPFDEKHWNDYVGYFKRIQVPSKTTLLQEGKISKKVFFIEKGCIRVWFNNNGNDVTFQFFLEGDRVSSTESFKKNIPSIVTIETIEPCTLWVIGKKDMDKMVSEAFEIPEVREKLIDSLFDRNIHYMKHCLSFIKDTPQQRYLNLIQEKPQIVQRIPQHYIASYLGITTVHLSRIKSKLAREKK
ncbi:Crp/Fnr family transcriptional regulator [Zunongwangia pacifica]|uniref:Crp/Fnr family transcriptional regulator n=1 Tax=Zunongwangia pacifica TaxID=2911062 RepID=A0A9X2CJY9_9FLAO|nr:Crp/Fnr family transcriptional regulator [Zunongwangia pacifica]MCL6216900.1 Crp/Fnr family transcriptional regulator [Zunongwangia pacifica]